MKKNNENIIKLSKKELKNLEFEYADLNINWKSMANGIILPDKNLFDFQSEEPHVELLKVIRNPEFFYFTCKYILNVHLSPFQVVILQKMWHHIFPMLIASRGAGKSFLLGIYCLLYSLIHQGRKVVITGAGFRQSKFVFDYMETVWRNAPILRNILYLPGEKRFGSSKDPDKWEFILGHSRVTAIPVGTGDKIRGQRANCVIAEEFSSMVPDIYEKVIAPFAAVNASPVEAARNRAKVEKLKEWNEWSEQQQELYEGSKSVNQSIISGTADYAFLHFGQYFKRYKAIIESRGDKEKLKAISTSKPDNEENENDLPNWKDFCIIRIPYDLLPKDYLNKESVGRSKSVISNLNFLMEYGAVFPEDSDEFFRRSVIESCVTNSPINGYKFAATLFGNPGLRYVYGIDPASESARFSISILEIHPDHRRLVYAWTTNRQEHGVKSREGLVTDNDFYAYCGRKIRSLMKIFPCEHIALDSQGGGVAVLEALHNKKNLEEGEVPIWMLRGDHNLGNGKDNPSDDEFGLHIIEMVNMADAEYTNMANHGLKKDMEDKILLFPYIDTVALGIQFEADNIAEKTGKKVFDTLEDCVWEIEETKKELTSIVHSKTPTGRDNWSTPEIKLPNSKKGRAQKDRYSSLLMANAAARRLSFIVPAVAYKAAGGFVGQKMEKPTGDLYSGPAWFVEEMRKNKGSYGALVQPEAYGV